VKVTSIKTHKITTEDKDLFKILDRYLPKLSEKSVVAVTSKIISICEGRVKPIEKTNRQQLVEDEAELFISPSENPFGVTLSIKNGTFIASAGIDESNGNGLYVLWPSHPQKWADKIREYLTQKFEIKHVGVIITDSKTTPLRYGVTGVAIAHSGFKALNSYIGKEDIFGKKMRVEQLNVMDSLATASVAVMGEGSEQTPLAVIEDVPFVDFQDRNPKQEELDSLKTTLDKDIYTPLLKSKLWKKGKGSS